MASRRRRGFTLLELAVVIAMIATLAAYFLDRALDNMETAERMAMETQARAIGAALQLQMAALITRGRMQSLADLARANPIDWLVAKPQNYLGELSAPPRGDEALGNWYYDPGARELVYLVRRGERFVPDAQGRKQVRFHVHVVHATAADSSSEPVGAVFRPVTPYQWR